MGLDIWLKKPWLRYLERIKSKIKVLVQFEVVYELNTLNTDKESCEFLKCLSLINVPHHSKCHRYAPSCADPTPRSHSGFPLLHLLHLTHQHISALRYHSGPSHHHLPLGQDKNLLTGLPTAALASLLYSLLAARITKKWKSDQDVLLAPKPSHHLRRLYVT